MSETQPHDPRVREAANKPIDTPNQSGILRATHHQPAIVWLILVLLVLQLVLGGIVVAQARRLLDLGERLELLEKKQLWESE